MRNRRVMFWFVMRDYGIIGFCYGIFFVVNLFFMNRFF